MKDSLCFGLNMREPPQVHVLGSGLPDYGTVFEAFGSLSDNKAVPRVDLCCPLHDRPPPPHAVHFLVPASLPTLMDWDFFEIMSQSKPFFPEVAYGWISSQQRNNRYIFHFTKRDWETLKAEQLRWSTLSPCILGFSPPTYSCTAMKWVLWLLKQGSILW